MASYTKDDVIQNRRCGLKYFDQAVTKIGKQNLLDETIRLAQDFPDNWGTRWKAIDWALGNACMNAINKHTIAQSYNLDEALTKDELKYLCQPFNLNPDEYIPYNERKIIKRNLKT